MHVVHTNWFQHTNTHITLITEINHGTITQQPFTTTLIVEGKKYREFGMAYVFQDIVIGSGVC